MKNLTVLSLAVIIVTLLFSCRSDEFSSIDGETIPKGGEPTTIVESNLTGVVLGQDKQPILGAEVRVSGILGHTDENGIFKFQNVDLSSDGSLIKITKEGYLDGFQFASGQAGEYSHNEVTLVKKIDQSFLSNIGGTIEANGGSLIVFEANSISYPNGQAYQGAVNIAAHWYDPNAEDLIYTMPGDLRGRDEMGAQVQLLTYGMMAVELVSPSGEELQLSSEKTATLKFPIPNSSDATTSEVIPTWHLDENTGVWIEEGEATVEEDFITAEVSHFSFWNVDKPFSFVNIKGSLVYGRQEIPLPYQTIVIKDNDNNVSQSGFSNETGVFTGAVPAGVNLTAYHLVCGNLNLIAEIGVLTDDKDLGEIIVAEQSSTALFGTLVDCAMQPISNGYVKITTPLETKVVSTNAEGIFSYTFFHCDESNVILEAYDFNSSKVSEPVIIDTEREEMTFGDIVVCEDIEGEYIRYFINDMTHALPMDNISVFIADERMIYINAFSNPDPNLSGASLLIKYDMIEEIAQYYAPGWTLAEEWLTSDGDDLEMQVSPLGEIGDMISLSFDNGEFRGDMRVEIDKFVESGTVSGNVWLDEDGNGLRDAGEAPAVGREVSLNYSWIMLEDYLYSSSYYPHPLLQPNKVLSDSEGNFVFTGALVELELQLSFSAHPNDVTLTIENEGNDDTIDSDFYDRFSASSNGKIQYNTDNFILENGGEKNDIGLGLIE